MPDREDPQEVIAPESADRQRHVTATRRTVLRSGLIAGAAAGATAAITAAVEASSAPEFKSALARSHAAPVHDFNGGWRFGGYVPGAELPGFNDSALEPVVLPHTVVPLSWADWDYTSWQKQWIYRKRFDASGFRGRRVLAEFDGVLTNAAVTINGVAAGGHVGGYLPWTTELTRHLSREQNLLAVVVDSRFIDVPPDYVPGGPPSMDYLQPGGIYRDVRLRVVPRVYLSDVFARPENVLSADRTITVLATVDAAAVPRGQATVTARLLDGGRVLASATVRTRIRAGQTTVKLRLAGLPEVSYWSPGKPALYTVRTTVSCDGELHEFDRRIGFREAVFTVDGFRLNGEPYPIFGLNRHQMFPYLGMAAPRRLQRRDAEIVRDELNCNMVRCSHYPQSRHFLDACDELGLMVWQEPPGWGHIGDAAFQRGVLQNVRDMVIRDRNRPSVIVWGTRLDETATYPALYAAARRLAYQYDGSRQTAGAVTFHSTSGFGRGWAEDVFSYDNYALADDEPLVLPPVPGVPYLISEAVGALDPTYLWTDPPAQLAHQATGHAIVHSQARTTPRIAGLIAWTAIDYYSASPAKTNWRTMRTPGVVDVFRVPKPGAAIYRAQCDPATAGPVIVPVFFWDHPPGPGRQAMIATNCDRLEIFVGGQHHATALPDSRRFAGLDRPPAFADLAISGPALPDLQIDGYLGGRKAASVRMSADLTKDRLLLVADGNQLLGDGSDTTRVTFRAVDGYGNQRRGASGMVTLSLSGPGVLIGQNPFDFGEFGGVGGAFVRARPGQTGPIVITADHATLGHAAVRVTATTTRSAENL